MPASATGEGAGRQGSKAPAATQATSHDQPDTRPSQPKRAAKSKPAAGLASQPLVGRVWWPPTEDRARTEFAGAYWPVRIVKKSQEQYEVTYDNGEVERVSSEHIFLDEPEVKFGEEVLPMQSGEFVEVHNGSKTDPSAWLAKMVHTDGRGMHWVEFPFHDPELPQKARPEHVRRARVMDNGEWKLVEPRQTWKDGEITSPRELRTIPETELGARLETSARVEAAAPPARVAAALVSGFKSAPKTEALLAAEQIGRVWWPPTADRTRTVFSGAYWPAKIRQKSRKQFEVTYDNGEVELVSHEHIFLHEPLVAFGQEVLPVQPGEFVEVHNGSATDPSAWLAKMVRTDDRGMHWVEFPFHDPEVPQKAKPEHVRRARVMDYGEWKLVEPKQTWEDGEVISPHELMTIDESELGEYVQLPASVPAASQQPSAPPPTARTSRHSSTGVIPAAPQASGKRTRSADESVPPPAPPPARQRKTGTS